jgi:hypothetical protein
MAGCAEALVLELAWEGGVPLLGLADSCEKICLALPRAGSRVTGPAGVGHGSTFASAQSEAIRPCVGKGDILACCSIHAKYVSVPHHSEINDV